MSSRPGVGSSFWFTIDVGAEPGQATPEELLPDQDLAGVAVLVVDRHATSRRSLSRQLSDWGMVVSTADSAAAALAHLRAGSQEGRPTAIALLDRSVPQLDGCDLSSLVEGDPTLSTHPILLIERGDEDHLVAPTFASLSKPVHLDSLRRCLRVAAGFSVADKVGSDRPRSPVEPAAGHLLLVEDNVINQKVALAMLTSVGYQVDVALNGAAAVEAAALRSYDAILMDCQMPEMNGYDATAAIRAMEGGGRSTPIIAMTAGARTEDRQRCLAAGMDGYLAKPVSKPVLLAQVASFLKPGCLQVPSAEPRPAALEDVRDDADFLAELVSQFVADTDARLDQLRVALETGDACAAASLAHSIKGSSGTVGGWRLALSCGRLEEWAMSGTLVAGRGELGEVANEYQELRRTLTRELATHR